jgi:hypothetical protein
MDVIIHCSASKFGNAAEITRWHLERGFSTIGYHYVILNGWIGSNKYYKWFDGAIETGRPIDDDKWFEPDEVGAHTLGHNNCVGICLVGNSNSFTIKQIESLKLLLSVLKKQWDIIKIYQHSDFEVKKPYCAGLNKSVMNELNNI